MNSIILPISLFCVFLSLVLFSSCKEGEPKPVFGVAFETPLWGIAESEDEVEVKLSFTTTTTVQHEIVITVQEVGGISYGVDYETSPAVSNNSMSLVVPAGEDGVSFTVSRIATGIEGGKELLFTIAAVTGEDEAIISGNTSAVVKFAAVISQGADMEALVGGPTQPNQAFIDFSLNKQQTIARVSWDLGFYTGDADRVILNYSTLTTAIALDKNDITTVTADDTLGMSAYMTTATPGSDMYIDHPDGDLTKTVIAAIAETDAENKVYIINRGGGPGTVPVSLGSADVSSTPRGWKKVRILKREGAYVVQYADIDDTSFEELVIQTNEQYHFTYFSFEAGIVEGEPAQEHWDITFTVASNLALDGVGTVYAYGYSDFVRINSLSGVSVAHVDTDSGGKDYDLFTKEDIDGLDFSNEAHTIGATWRSVFSGTVYDHLYFIVKDAEGNYYKLQFLGLLDSDGARGHSTFKYKLL